jgi:CYTH domain-containing protein
MFNSGHHLIVAEIEIPTKNHKVNIPNFISDKLLLEVTGLKQFSNRNLSNKI